jgi:hypothetical protein
MLILGRLFWLLLPHSVHVHVISVEKISKRLDCPNLDWYSRHPNKKAAFVFAEWRLVPSNLNLDGAYLRGKAMRVLSKYRSLSCMAYTVNRTSARSAAIRRPPLLSVDRPRRAPQRDPIVIFFLFKMSPACDISR